MSIFSWNFWDFLFKVETTRVIVPKMLAIKRAPVTERTQTAWMCLFVYGPVSFPSKINIAA